MILGSSGVARIKDLLPAAGISVALFSISFVLRYLAFSQTVYANGWDGYFYINQVRSFLEEGKMDVADSALIYPIMMGVQCFTGDYILMYKVTGAILASAFCVMAYLLSLKWSGRNAVALIVGSFCLFSPHLTYFAAQYPKNLLGVIFFLMLLYGADARLKVIPLLLLALNFFGHRVTAVLSLAYMTLYAAMKRMPGRIAMVLILFLFVFVVAGFFLPGILNFFDSERLQGIFSQHPQFAPYSFVSGFGPGLISSWWLAEIVFCCLVFLAALVLVIKAIIKKNAEARFTALILIAAFLIFPFFHWSMDAPGFRLLLVFILLCPLFITFLLKDVRLRYIAPVSCAMLLFFSAFSYRSYDPSRHDPPYGLYSMMCRELVASKEPCELIIAHKSLAEYVVYATGTDAMSWIPEYNIEKEKLWRIAAGIKDVQFRFYLSPDDLKHIHRLSPSYTFVREDIWKKFIANVRQDGNEELISELTNWRNPDKGRPYFLLKNKR
ncbi:hypothetical protein KK083_11895 [Fulvivirgaceae bacterium PWU4]|uniref:Uncharacterized protein n=1 Tax=Chryseosolibacter histidini TaxID=2782349 RepID=A0AAP2GN28_9BACT|nr:hypothetical protein [Chryseosolibacter histidini]MBT1697583.1 hypothetical protein [Chryseosolibacter histidini]